MKLTKDDERARRICSLALEFMNAASPVCSSEVARSFYADLSPESFRRAFARDRDALAACGIVVKEVPSHGEESSWRVDEGRSFAGGVELSAQEATVLDLVCQPLSQDQSWGFSSELRFALAKLTRAFAESALAVSEPQERTLKALPALRTALVSGVAVRATYTTASGETSERTLAPHAFFELRGTLYLVAGRLDKEGQPVEGSTRTYRVDRFSAVSALSQVPVSVPEDFSVQDWRRLPFQLGEATLTATFEVPPERADSLRRAALGHGKLSEKDGRLIWTVHVADTSAAASWAVAQGIRPLAPDELVGAWREVLEGCVRAAGERPEGAAASRAATDSGRPASGSATKAKTGRPGSLDEARALVALVASLSEAGDAVSAEAVAAKLGVTREHAEKLVELLLTSTGTGGGRLPLVEEKGEVTLLLSNGMRGRRLRLTRSETMAVAAALRQLGVSEDDPLRKKLEDSLAAEPLDLSLVERVISPTSATDAAGTSQTLVLCAQARAARQAVNFSYHKEGAAVAERRHVVPQALRHESDAWYLDGFDLDRQGERTFRADRMEDVRLLARGAAATAPDTPAAPAPGRSARAVTLTFSDARYLDLLDWHGLGPLTRNTDGTLSGELPFYGGSWLPRMVAACAGTAAVNDADITDAARAYARDQLSRAPAYPSCPARQSSM